MPNWNELLGELRAGSNFDIVRRKYLRHLHDVTNRNVIIYYSGWLQKPGLSGSAPQISDADKLGFMSTIHKLDRSKGLDLVIHTPGGDVAATESIGHYLRQMFGSDIRAIVPELAMSGGTLICCACKRIAMGKHSSLGPIDPQLGVFAAHGVLEEFEHAYEDIKKDPTKTALWLPIIQKYPPTLIGECRKAIAWAAAVAREWLSTGMFLEDEDKDERIQKILDELNSHAQSLSHNRHYPATKCQELGFHIESLEAEGNEALQDAVLTLHHSVIHTLSSTPAMKIIENHEGTAFVLQA